jgi:hypothetical protein
VTLSARVASASAGGTIQVRLGTTNGPLIGTLTVPNTGGWQIYSTVSTALTNAAGIQNLVLRFVGGGGYLLNVEWLEFAPISVPVTLLPGGIIGTVGSYNNSGNTISNVFDDNLNTFFDGPTGNGCWVGLDFGAGTSNVITQINCCPRTGFESRMVGGSFQGANRADFSDAVTLGSVTVQPASAVFTQSSVTNLSPFRFVRYLSPNGGWGNVSELQFLGYRFVRPYVNAAVANAALVLSWPAASPGYTVQRSTNLAQGIWLDVASPPAVYNGGQWQVVLPPPTNSAPDYYRLAR